MDAAIVVDVDAVNNRIAFAFSEAIVSKPHYLREEHYSVDSHCLFILPGHPSFATIVEWLNSSALK